MKRWNATKIIAFGFALIILLGALLLTIPQASRDGSWTSFPDALFTAASASCVTGLAVFDTWTHFSFLGQLIILLLIQIGGLGFMAFSMLFSLSFGRRIGLRERSLLEDTLDSLQLSGVIRLTRRMLLGTLLFEGTGTLLLSVRFVPMFGVGRGIWFSVFHAVSAFCNAGFDLMGIRAPGSSLTGFAGDPLVILTLSFLILVGGLGFIVWNDLIEKKFCVRKLSLHAKVVLSLTALLLVGGTAVFYVTEFSVSLRGMSGGEKLLASFFQSVTTRTAGFYSVPQTALSNAGYFVTLLLMTIGAAPGGTGGGLKITTIAVIAADVSTQRRGREDTELFHRRISTDVIRRAYCGTALYLVLAAIGVFILTAQGISGGKAVYEVLSAIGTVGLSLDLTASLPALSRLAIILLMYAGRVGSLTVFTAITPGSRRKNLRDPMGKIIVG